MRHLAFQRIHMGPHQRLGQDQVTVFDGINHAATGLGLDIDADRAEGQFALERAACHGGGRGKQCHVVHGNLARRGIVAPLAFGQRLDQRHKDAQHPLVLGHPAFLHPAQRGGAGGVAGDDHQIAARIEHACDRPGGQIIDVVGIAHAIGGMGIVAEIDKGHLRQALRHGVQHGQPAKSAVEYPNCHRLRPQYLRRGSPPVRCLSSNSKPYSKDLRGSGESA